ncbi:hypothetical protein [Cellulomonas marina]|uniref:Uncharacterized protein n=1 Tax=Cellulomonas marina TaxID=988821 RepID=A0A1I0Y4U4_9CELL|nr:hypothetical protein [Cellulomonas marina]GIG29771.1 hypothetical protein Cma02nite_23710 [Cellulomonas marina]SFB07756.1 hypothetical protein SAMN05421867_106153 [Cellulomonas marina]
MSTTPEHAPEHAAADATSDGPVPGAADSDYVESLVGDDDGADVGDASDTAGAATADSVLGPDDEEDTPVAGTGDGVVPVAGQAPPAGPANPGAFGPR